MKCLHCDQVSEEKFCCNGCNAAYDLINNLGLESYYLSRTIITPGSIKPNIEKISFSSFVIKENKEKSLRLMISHIQCAACVWLIESCLRNRDDVIYARVNMSTRRLTVKWVGDVGYGDDLMYMIMQMGYNVTPFSSNEFIESEIREERFLLKCLAISGFAAGNIMFISIILWTASLDNLGHATKVILHLISAMIGLSTIIYAGRPFFYSALKALSNKSTNMDVPIAVAIILASIMSIMQLEGEYIYFDSATMLLFFLLIGRYLDRKIKAKTKHAAYDLLSMMAGNATVLVGGITKIIPVKEITENMVILIPVGTKIPVDGVVIEGKSDLDTSIITGETLPSEVTTSDIVFSGSINLSFPITIKALKSPDNTLLSEIISLIEKSEESKTKYTAIADTMSKYYTPFVHFVAIVTFCGWIYFGVGWKFALLRSITVLLITCPCALALAVPVVGVIASNRLFKRGILLKSGEALERLNVIDHIIFDKTGTLTIGKPKLQNPEKYSIETLQIAASLASKSSHPLSRAIISSFYGKIIECDVKEEIGCGLTGSINGHEVKLGKRDWCGVSSSDKNTVVELWLRIEKNEPIQFIFEDKLRDDSKYVIDIFKSKNIGIDLLSGDREDAVKNIASIINLSSYKSAMLPNEKYEYLMTLKASGKKILMVGDGLNDAPSLSYADISISPSSASDLTQNEADIVFQGDKLYPVLECWNVAKLSNKLIKQNFAIALCYNIIAIPAAILGYVTPLIAALAMSSSSILVMLNSFRLNK